jgi:hypothetical protein
MSTPASRPVAGITDRISELYRRELLLAHQKHRAEQVDENFVGSRVAAMDASVHRADRQVAVENASSRYRAYASRVLPQRFQTADYAHRVGAEVPTRPFDQLRAQSWERQSRPLLVLNHDFLSQPLDDHRVMAGQLVYLLSLIKDRQAEVRIVKGHWGDGTVVELDLDKRDVLVTEGWGMTCYRADPFQVPLHTYEFCQILEQALPVEESHSLLTDAHDHHAREAAKS